MYKLNNKPSRRKYEQAKRSVVLLDIVLHKLGVLTLRTNYRLNYDKLTRKMNERWNLFG